MTMPVNPGVTTDSEREWPGVAPAQAYVLPSYQWMVARYEAADSRIQSLLTFVATVTFAVPTLSRAIRPEIPLRSRWFICAVGIAVLVAGIGLYARLTGSLVLPSPAALWQTSMKLSTWEFQRDAFYFAGQHYEANRKIVNRKAAAAGIMVVLFACELLLMLIWVSRA